MCAGIKSLTTELMMIPGLSGHEDRVRRAIQNHLTAVPVPFRTDRLGNLIATLPGDPAKPSVMVFAHMDQLGFVVRKIEESGLLRIERLGGVPDRALASQAVLIALGEGRDVAGVIANKSHHATSAEEKHQVVRPEDLCVDAGHGSRASAESAGIQIGSAVVYRPAALELAGNRLAGTSIDDRAGCAALIQLAGLVRGMERRPTVHFVFSVQEEFNLRGAAVAAQQLNPDIAVQIDLMLATDTPGMRGRGEMRLGGGPGMSLYSFHGRGTLNGVIPHPAAVRLVETAARDDGIPLQRSAQRGILTDLSYVQLEGDGVASIDVGFPVRYSHSSLEVCDLSDLEQLVQLLCGVIRGIDSDFDFHREEAGR